MISNIKPKIAIAGTQTENQTRPRFTTTYEDAIAIFNDDTPLTEEESKLLSQCRIGFAMADVDWPIPASLLNYPSIDLQLSVRYSGFVRLIEAPRPVKNEQWEAITKSDFAIHIRELAMKAILNNQLPIGFWRKVVKEIKRNHRGDPNLFLQRYASPDYFLPFNEENYSSLNREEARTLRRLREEQVKVCKGEIKGVKTAYSYTISGSDTTPSLFREYLLSAVSHTSGG